MDHNLYADVLEILSIYGRTRYTIILLLKHCTFIVIIHCLTVMTYLSSNYFNFDFKDKKNQKKLKLY